METNDDNELPVIPLSPITRSYILSSNALSQATEKLNESKQIYPQVSVDILRSLIQTTRVERHRLDALSQKMQSVEAATALFWDSDTLARQIAIINCQLYNAVWLDKHALSQLDMQQTKLCHLIDFHDYLTHSMAHQLIYWAELIKAENTTTVVPPIRSKDDLIAHLVRVAYLLLHAYRDFSGFAAIVKALDLPEVRRLNQLWQACPSRTKDMLNELIHTISPTNNFQAYHHSLYNKLEFCAQLRNNHHDNSETMIAIPWIQPHLSSIQSIIDFYTADSNKKDQRMLDKDFILSTPGAHKLDIEVSILELCQRNSTLNDSLSEDILDQTRSRQSSLASKAIHLEGLRTAVIPATNLNQLAPGDQLAHHWLVSRVYLSRDQLVDESIEVEPLIPGERILAKQSAVSAPISRRTSFVRQKHPGERMESSDVIQKPYKTNDVNAKPIIDLRYKTFQYLTKQQDDKKRDEAISDVSSTNLSKPKSSLSPSAPIFIPTESSSGKQSTTSSERWSGYPIDDEDNDSEVWLGYPAQGSDDDDSEIWKGYPCPNSDTDSPRRDSSQSETFEEWKGYHATKMEANWQREIAMKVKEYEWQGYTLETYNEDELDSSTMKNGQFEKSRKVRGQQGNQDKLLGDFQRKTMIK